MARIPRYMIIGNDSLFHVTWRCHNRSPFLATQWAKKYYYNLLLKYKNRYQMTFFAYCFMDNHVHLCGKCGEKTLFSDFFRTVNSKFALAFNRKYNREDQVIKDRFKSPRIQTEEYLLNVMAYIDLNPARAKKVSHPTHNTFSSYAFYAKGRPDPLLTPAPTYIGSADTPKERRKAYRKLVLGIFKQYPVRAKERYSTSSFIGDVIWASNQSATLKAFSVAQYQQWRAAHNQKFSGFI